MMVPRRDCKKKLKHNAGLTLVELLVATGIFAISFIAIIVSFLRCMDLNEMSSKSSVALGIVKNRIELIADAPKNTIFGTYNNVFFADAALSGAGVSYIDNSNPDLVKITVNYCWRQKNGLVVGEDIDLDGVKDAGEDKNNNNMLDSPVQLVSFVF